MNAWEVVPRTIIVFLVAILYARWAKKRFIAQASAIDLVVAVIFGSMLSRAINGGATLISSLSGGLVLIICHRILLHFAARYPRFYGLVKGHSEVVYRDGEYVREEMEHHDLAEADVMQEMRTSALTDDLASVKYATLERSGRISVVLKDRCEQPVQGPS